MSWYVNPTVNEGYPSNTGFPASYPADWSGNYPASAWRVSPGVNEGYPYTWWHIAIDSGKYYDPNIPIGGDFPPDTPEGQGMDTGGAKSNYPNGFTNSNRGTIYEQFNGDGMNPGGAGILRLTSLMASALNGRMWALSGAKLKEVLTSMNDTNIFDSTTMIAIQAMYGANIYDAIVVCKAYPFALGANVVDSQTADLKLYNRYQVATGCNPATRTWTQLNLGEITLDISQAWELESIDYSIYLPYAGVFPLDVRAGETISVRGTVDLVSGVCEYAIRQNGQITAIYKANIGIDVPLNFDQGITQSNMIGNIASSVAQGLPVIAGAAGTTAVSAIGNMAGSAISKYLTTHNTVQAPQVGCMASIQSYPYARIIAKIPKMFRDGYGYKETLGENRSTTFTQLSECSGYVKTRNYKTPLISATEEEKRKIESLMNSGVIL